MIRWPMRAACWLLLAPLAPATAQSRPQDYAVSLPITPAPGAPLQRLAIPARALAAVQNSDLADLRVFDAAGTALPMALLPRAIRRERRDITLPALPILGRPGALRVTGLSLRIDDNQNARVVNVEGAVEPGPDTTVLGVLFDTRAVANPAAGLVLDADLPAMQPVTFSVEASADLKNWRQIAERVLYRAGTAAVRPEVIALGDIVIKGEYLRVRWRSDAPLVGPVRVRGAVLSTARRIDSGPQPRLRILGVSAEGPHVLGFALPFAAPLSAIRITPVAAAAIVPVRILGRNNREQPWAAIGSGTVYRLPGARPVQPIMLAGAAYRNIRIEADSRTPGFAAPPAIEVTFEPVEIVFLVAGTPPYALVAGRAEAPAAYLPVGTLVPDRDAAATSALPRAIVPGADAPATLSAVAAETGIPQRTIILWGVLLAGTAALAGMVVLLMRRR